MALFTEVTVCDYKSNFIILKIVYKSWNNLEGPHKNELLRPVCDASALE
jgi:hypothetical protein